MKLQACQLPVEMGKYLMNIKEIGGFDDGCQQKKQTSIYLHLAEMGLWQIDGGIGSGLKQMAASNGLI